MKTHYLVSSFLIASVLFAGCSSSRQTARVPESRSGSVATPLPSDNELSLIGVRSKFLEKDTSTMRVYLYVDALKGKSPVAASEFGGLYTLNYVIYSDYGTRDRLGYGNVPLNSSNLSQSGDQVVIQFDIKKPNKDYGVLLSEISQTGTLKKVLNDLPIRFREQRASDRYGIFNANGEVPVQRHYVNQGEPFQVKNLRNESERLYVYYYSHPFDPAGSPMNTVPRSVAKTLQVDSIFTINTGQSLTFENEGLYYMLADTTRTEGLGLLVTNERYPKMTNPEDLVEPLLYMSTNQEINELQSAQNHKKALDKYWLSLMNGNPDLARQVIKNYYNRVEEANRLFTSYKEGWKTDKGMIYIILGPPDKVQRSKDKEVWSYDQRANASNVNFTFNRRTNQFVDDHYELVRYVEYQPIWYPIVEAWRNGAIR
ncbi:GWxTD domain-containing protein [Telluribacter sp.]|jgi:GWxTD domain-containing protein|uniref:GWxTD domain-containing protein n=1 Tax=Telluribacter sp. TaxID=1978767 RepID=UPI002E10F4AB|nr:GWxTD domain-containing protein [Telluribacter sp.]